MSSKSDQEINKIRILKNWIRLKFLTKKLFFAILKAGRAKASQLKQKK
jgi:hypothetical protein